MAEICESDFYYINVFRDSAGEIHYSCEEFSIYCNGLVTFEGAVSDAYHHAVIGNWTYIGTLKSDAPITAQMHERVKSLEQAKAIVEGQGRLAVALSVDEIEVIAFSL